MTLEITEGLPIELDGSKAGVSRLASVWLTQARSSVAIAPGLLLQHIFHQVLFKFFF